MATKLPINALPFLDETEVATYEVPNGTEFTGTKKEYYDHLMALWYPQQAELSALVEREKNYRNQIAKLLFPDGWDEDGTTKFEMPSGWVLEFERRLNVTLDKAALPSIIEAILALPPDPETGEIGSVAGVISYDPKMSLSGYRKMRPDAKALLNDAVEIRPGTPGMKMKPPSARASTKASDQKARGRE